MENNRESNKVVQHFFHLWQIEREEKWLSKMAKEGWVLEKVKITFWGIKTYFFKKIEPTDSVYRIDYKRNKEDMKQYVELFEDSGWSKIASEFELSKNKTSSMHYFVHMGNSAEIYTNEETKAGLYMRLLYLALIYCWLPIIFFISIMDSDSSYNFLRLFSVIVMGGWTIYWIYGIVKILRRILKLLVGYEALSEKEIVEYSIESGVKEFFELKNKKQIKFLAASSLVIIFSGLFLVGAEIGEIIGRVLYVITH